MTFFSLLCIYFFCVWHQASLIYIITIVIFTTDPLTLLCIRVAFPWNIRICISTAAMYIIFPCWRAPRLTNGRVITARTSVWNFFFFTLSLWPRCTHTTYTRNHPRFFFLKPSQRYKNKTKPSVFFLYYYYYYFYYY